MEQGVLHREMAQELRDLIFERPARQMGVFPSLLRVHEAGLGLSLGTAQPSVPVFICCNRTERGMAKRAKANMDWRIKRLDMPRPFRARRG